MFSTLINPQHYTSTSLREDIHTAADVKNTLSLELIANIIVKYMFVYFYFNPDEKIPLEDIENLIREVEETSELLPTESEIREMFDADKFAVSSRFHMERFQCEMLLDVPATVEIFRDIAQRIIDPCAFGGKYVGLDLGTGSGILMIAQYIQAKRNGFGEIKNLGIELGSVSASVAEIIVQNRLKMGEVLCADTTKKETYTGLLQGQPLTFVSNETIPDALAGLGYNVEEGDPFLLNCRVLESLPEVTNGTQFFPQRVIIAIYGEKRGFPFKVSSLPLLGGNENTPLGKARLLWQLITSGKAPLHNDSNVRIIRIGVGEDLLRHEEVGAHVIQENIARRSSVLRPRWIGIDVQKDPQ